MPFDGPAGVLMQTSDAGEAEQLSDFSEPAVFFVNVREPLRRCELCVKKRYSIIYFTAQLHSASWREYAIAMALVGVHRHGDGGE